MPILINRFEGGLVDFLSARDLSPKQFQRLENMRINRVTRLVKRPGEGARTAESATALQVLPGMGHIQYRAERDESNVHVNSHFRTISLVDITGTPVVSIRRNNSINDDTGTFTEFLGSSVWILRQVVGSSNISFDGNEITKAAGLDIFFPGDMIRIYGSGEDNDGYVHVVSATATIITVVEDLTTATNTSAVLIAFPHVSMYAINGILRVSDGVFHDTAPSQWYGHIKRDFWGNGVTYGSDSGRYSQPPMNEAYNNWKLENQELVAPTIVIGTKAGQNTSAANQIAIHKGIIHPATWPDKAVDVEWNARDRVTATFVYDFVQESELGRSASGEIGIPMGTVLDADLARTFMVELYTGTANASWSRRVTAIRLYYKFHDDPDWYEVVTLNVEKGWSESELVFDAENTGYWQPIITSIKGSGTTDAAGGSGTTINDTGHGVSQGEGIYLYSTAGIAPASLCTVAASVAANDITLLVAAVDSLGVNPANYNSLDYCYGVISTTAVATFYIPFTGEKSYSYATYTGRAAKLKVPATRWRAAATDGASALIGNIDTLDENDQTLREHSRVMETPAGMSDTFYLAKSKDVGIFEGDEIMAIADYQNNWWVMKERNIHVLQKNTLKALGQFRGIGCRWMHAFVVTPWGLCVADESGIFLLPSSEELSFPIRATYQGLTFFNPILTYSHLNKQLHFVPDTSSVTSIMLTRDMLNKGWMKDNFPAKTSLSNFAEGRHYEPEVMFEDGDPTLNLITSTDAYGNSAASTDTWDGATGSTPPDGWQSLGGTPTFTITDLDAVVNFDTDVLVIVGGSMTVRPNFFQDAASGGEGNEAKFGKVYRVSFAYRLDKDGSTNTQWISIAGNYQDLTDTGLAGDATLYSADLIATDAYSIKRLFQVLARDAGAPTPTLQIDNLVVTQLNSYHVKQLNKGTCDETGLLQTGDIVLGNDPVQIRNVYLSYKSSSVDVTVKVYLDNQTIPTKTMTLDASSTLRNKVPILLNTTSEVLSLSFESTATDFTIEDIEIPDKEITVLDR